MITEVHHTDAWKHIAAMPDNSVSAIITDPMYKDTVNMPELLRVCSGNIVMFCDPRYRFFAPDEVALWMKPPSSKNTSRHLAHPWEEILILRRGADVYNADLESANYNGIYYDILQGKRDHPFEKPATLCERLVHIYTNPGDIVFDPFFGSGAILKAAAKLGRRALGCEMDAGHFSKFVEGMAG